MIVPETFFQENASCASDEAKVKSMKLVWLVAGSFALIISPLQAQER